MKLLRLRIIIGVGVLGKARAAASGLQHQLGAPAHVCREEMVYATKLCGHLPEIGETGARY